MTYLVLGAGMMGRAAAYDLAITEPGARVILADVDAAAAEKAARAIAPNVVPLGLDVNNEAALAAAFEGCSAAVAAVSYSVNERLTHAAIAAGVPLCDLGGNNDVVERQLSLDARAKERGTTVIPNCGLAPGLINILGAAGAGRFDAVDAIRLRVGGLPRYPRPPLNYQIVFSVEGLINEYVEPAEVIRDGCRLSVTSMDDLEQIEFPAPFGMLEAFNTSGGLSTLPAVLGGRVKNLDYKTIRYPGHCEKMKTLLDLGFASTEPLVAAGGIRTHREVFAELLRKKLDTGGPDVVLARATITGKRNGKDATLAYELIDYYDESTGLSAMMRTTAFPTTIIARMLAHGEITVSGVMPPEACVPEEALLRELRLRNIHITRTLTP